MSKRRDVDQHLRQLNDMRDIMQSMKALAFMETHKLAQFITAQREAVLTIETVAADLLHYNPTLLTSGLPVHRACLMVGSERGFCGDFNEALIRRLPHSADITLLAVGQKMQSILADDMRTVKNIDGANAAEEVVTVLDSIAAELSALQYEYGTFSLEVLFHNDKDGDSELKTLLPPFGQLAEIEKIHASPPLLYLSIQHFFTALVERHVYAALNEILFSSLMLENTRRVQHLTGAVKHLEDKSLLLSQQSRTLRQEEITEEIEVILLNANQ